MKTYRSKIMRVINFIRNEKKFERGDMVVVTYLNNNEYKEKYLKYVGSLGIVVNMDYAKKDYIVAVKFEDGNTFDFIPSELRKIRPEEPIRYKKLKIEI
jgi:ribosomal protein L21E